MQIVEATQPVETEVARRLFRAYAASLPFSLDYQNFDAELAGLPAPYSPPRGGILLAMRDATAVGVLGLKPLTSDIAEIKRLYVLPEARAAGIGRALLARALREAVRRGHRRVRLDSHRASMGAAIALYRQFGFVEIPPYGPNPGEAFAFFEKKLRG